MSETPLMYKDSAVVGGVAMIHGGGVGGRALRGHYHRVTVTQLVTSYLILKKCWEHSSLRAY